jgi:hypothetical protein
MPKPQSRRTTARAATATTSHALSPISSSTGGGPAHLINCEPLAVRQDCDAVYFSQIFELAQKKTPDSPIVHPCRIVGRLREILHKQNDLEARLHALVAKLSDKKGKYRDFTFQQLIMAQRRYSSRRRRFRFGELPVPRKEGRGHAHQMMFTASPGRSGIGETTIPGLPGAEQIGDWVRGIIEDLIIPKLPPSAEPTVALSVLYRQDWCSLGYNRGRLIRTIPLTADGKKEIIVKTWRTRKERREENKSVAEDISTEFIGDQKWSLTTLKEVSANMNANINANLKADLSVPIPSTPATVGAGGGGGGNAGGNVNTLMRETEERISQATVKATNSLKTSVTSIVETAEESGTETTITETIINPNKCHSLMYDFFEVVETFDIKTTIDRVEPVILLPSRLPEITPAWVLCHECLLRKYLPCETYYVGFDGAKQLEIAERLGQFAGTIDSPQAAAAAQAVLDAIAAVVSAYRSLSDATLNIVADGSGDSSLADLVQGKWDELMEWGEETLEEGAAAVEEGVKVVEEVVKVVTDTVSEGAKLVDDIIPFSMARRASGQRIAQAQRSSVPGGIGSYIYWEVMKIVAPEITAALAQLEAAHAQIASMPVGPARTTATFNAVNAFFTTAGDVTAAFKKMDVALFFLLASAITTLGVGGALVGSLAAAAAIVLGGGVAVPILIGLATGFLGGAAIGALTGLGLTIMAELGEDIGKLDLTPDDNGLKAAIMGLFGLQNNLGGAIGLPAQPQNASPEALAAYQQQLIELKKEQRERAEAGVEFERLKCHLTENLVYYAQLVIQSWPEATLQQFLSKHGVPERAVIPRVVGFAGAKVGFQVVDQQWLAASGFDFDRAFKDLKATGVLDDALEAPQVTLPTPGVSVEPRLGSCEACESFVQTHRQFDLDLKKEEVAQAVIETDRRRQRVGTGELDDPLNRDARIAVSVTPAGPAADDGNDNT